jgi:hypothetical protein
VPAVLRPLNPRPFRAAGLLTPVLSRSSTPWRTDPLREIVALDELHDEPSIVHAVNLRDVRGFSGASVFELRLFSTIMTLGTPKDVTHKELRIETFVPADEASERAWRCVAL